MTILTNYENVTINLFSPVYIHNQHVHIITYFSERLTVKIYREKQLMNLNLI